MDRQRAIIVLQSLQGSLNARGIAHAALVGSVARGQEHAASDIDIVVTPQPGRKLGLFDLGAIQSILEAGFGDRRVDVIVEPIRRDDLRERTRRDRVHAF